MPRGPFTVLAFASIAHLFTHLMMLVYATVVLTLEDEWGVDYGTLVALASTGWLLFGLGALPSGWLADRWNAPGMIAVFFFGLGGASVLTGFADSPGEMAVGLAAIGLFAAIYHPVGIPWLLRHATRRKGLAVGVNGFFGAVGIAIAPVVAVACAGTIGWRWTFYIPGALLIGLGVLHLALSPRDVPVEADAVSDRPPRFRDPAMLRILLALGAMAFAGGMVFHSTAVAMPKMFDGAATSFAEAMLGAGADTGILVTAIYLLAGCGQVAVGALADRMPKRAMFLLAYTVQIPVLVLVGWLTGAPLVAMALLAASLTLGSQAVEDLLVVRSVPPSWISRVFASRFVLGMGAGVLAPPLVGFGYAWTGDFSVVFLVLAAMAGLVVLAATRLPPDRSVGRASVVPAE